MEQTAKKKPGKRGRHEIGKLNKNRMSPAKAAQIRREENRRRNAARKDTVRRQRIILGAAAVLAVLYLARSFYYTGHFESRSFVNGVDVSGLSLKEAAEKLYTAGDHYSLTVKGLDGAEETIRDPALAVRVTDTSNVKNALSEQKAFAWVTENLRRKTYQVELSMEVDEEVLKQDVSSLKMLDASAMEPPEDASLSETEDGTYEIVPEKLGTTIDVEKAENAVTEAVKAGRSEVDLAPCRILPTVLQNDENLLKRKSEWNDFLSAAGLTYEISGTTEILDGPVIASLLEDDGETVDISYALVADLMAKWRERHNTYKHKFNFRTHSGETVEINPNGDYGFELDEKDTAEDLIARIRAHDTGTYRVQYYHEPPYTGNNGLGDTYIEISIDDQHVWLWKDGEVLVETDVVTGLPTNGRYTYTGCYELKDKQTNVVLGSIDLQGYASEVNYWLPFNKTEGLHDAPWRDYFGGDIYLTAGSHGCVNVPEDVMAEIYEKAEVGEAVVLYGGSFDGDREADQAEAADKRAAEKRAESEE